ncbi:MAG TPA: polyprenyl synthetase family protein [Novosphingobium sp.]|nr:polyprenyl synthetase family protein [Novosphingobium sp.]
MTAETASQRIGATQSAPAHNPSLDPILTLTAPGMERVNAVILDRMQSDIPLIPKLAGHLISGGGKRMRPMLTVAAAELAGYEGTHHHKLSAAVEFIHTATLLHDDVVDGSDLRRGKAAANIIFGNPATVLVGDFLFSRAFELMVEAENLKVLQILANASAVIAEGEVDQLTAQRKVETTQGHYLDIIAAKTAALFAAATRVGAVVAGCSPEQERALEDYGRYLGVAFQLVDDAIDYDSEAAEMGKGKGDDFRDGKMTLPVILSYERGNEEERQFWRDAIAGFRTEDEDLAEAIEIIARHGTVEDTRARAEDYARKAIDALSIFPASPIRAAMEEAALFAVARRY